MTVPASPYLRFKNSKFENSFKKIARRFSVRYSQERIDKASCECLIALVSSHLSSVTISFRRVQVKLEDDAKKDTTMKWYSYLILLFMYIVYLGLGAYVFQRFEQPNEVTMTPRCHQQ